MRLLMADRRRRALRDAKLMFREELVADRTQAQKRVYPCNICLGETRSLLYRSVVNQHLRTYGRHPYHRGSTEVQFITPFISFVGTQF